MRIIHKNLQYMIVDDQLFMSNTFIHKHCQLLISEILDLYHVLVYVWESRSLDSHAAS
jgi:hypothetical protein